MMMKKHKIIDLIGASLLFLTACNQLTVGGKKLYGSFPSKKRVDSNSPSKTPIIKRNLQLTFRQKKFVLDSWLKELSMEKNSIPHELEYLLHQYSRTVCSSNYCPICQQSTITKNRGSGFSLRNSFSVRFGEERFTDLIFVSPNLFVSRHSLDDEAILKSWSPDGEFYHINIKERLIGELLFQTPSGGFSLGHWMDNGRFNVDNKGNITYQLTNRREEEDLNDRAPVYSQIGFNEALLLCNGETLSTVIETKERSLLWRGSDGTHKMYLDVGPSAVASGVALPNNLVLINNYNGELQVFDLSNTTTEKQPIVKKEKAGIFRGLMYFHDQSLMVCWGDLGIELWHFDLLKPQEITKMKNITTSICWAAVKTSESGCFVVCEKVGKNKASIGEYDIRDPNKMKKEKLKEIRISDSFSRMSLAINSTKDRLLFGQQDGKIFSFGKE